MRTASRLAIIATAMTSVAVIGSAATASRTGTRQSPPRIVAHIKNAITVDGLRFHDLSGDGKLQPYEDWRLPTDVRSRDLLSRMTLREKAGLMMFGTPPTADGSFRGPWSIRKMATSIERDGIRFFIHRMTGDIKQMAELSNAAQEVAERTRLGIPLTLSSDSRNTIREVQGVSVAPACFTRWPEGLGLAAIGDPALVRRLSAIAAREYKAIGIRVALSPQADLFTEPRWFRGNATFGDTPEQVSPMVAAYIEGFQGGKTGLHPGSVAAVVKHWAGYGAQPDGLDSHNPYGQTNVFPGGNFANHLKAFDGAFKAHVAGVMPTYARPAGGLTIAGKPAESVGAGFSKQMLTDLLRGQYRYDGLIVSDWNITSDCPQECMTGTFDVEKLGMPWGVEGLTKPQRFAKAIDAGVDQFGGVMDTQIVVDLVANGLVTTARLDQSVMRILRQTFALGLFENAYVDADASVAAVGTVEALALGLDAQHRSMVLLENKQNLLPLRQPGGTKVWLYRVDPAKARALGLVPVADPAQAQVALLRVNTPYTSHEKFFFGAAAHEGDLSFKPDSDAYRAIARAKAAGIPVVVDVYLDRPAILTNIKPLATALLGDYGVTEEAFLDVVVGRAAPQGRLPIELPSSDAEVVAQLPDMPSDTKHPLYSKGYGLRYR